MVHYIYKKPPAGKRRKEVFSDYVLLLLWKAVCLKSVLNILLDVSSEFWSETGGVLLLLVGDF